MSSRARSQELAHRQRLPLHAAGCVHSRLSLSPYPSPRRQHRVQHTATAILFCSLGPGLLPIFLVLCHNASPMHLFFEFWPQGDLGLTVPITTTAEADGDVGVFHPDKIPRYKYWKPTKEGAQGYPQYLFEFGSVSLTHFWVLRSNAIFCTRLFWILNPEALPMCRPNAP